MSRRSRMIFSAAVLTAAVTFFPGCRREPDTPRLKNAESSNLLLITIDSLRADRLGAVGRAASLTPHCDRLAARGALFTRVYAPAPQTLPSHASLLTGREPPVHGVRRDGGPALPPSETTWAEVMRGAGYETFALVSSFRLHSRFGLDQGFDRYDDSLDFSQAFNTLNTSITADKVSARFRAWLERASGKKFFAWVHFSDPRPPHRLLAEFSSGYKNDPYGGSVAQVDHFIGEVTTLLDARGLGSRTVVVVAGSHGERLLEDREPGDGMYGYEETLRVPVLVSHPELFSVPRTTDRRARLYDVLPSLLELFRLEVPAGVRGRSLWPLLSDRREREEAERPVYFESRRGVEEMSLAPLYGLIHGPYKLLSLPRDEVYDLRTDPGERDNLAPKDKELAAAMNGRLQDHLASMGESGRPDRSTGPVEGASAVVRLMRAERLMAEEKTSEAEKELEAVLRDHPDRKLPLAYDHLFSVASKNNDLRQAEEVLRRAAVAFPEIGRFSVALAQILADSGRPDEAEKVCLKALDLDPRLSPALILLGTVYGRKGETGKALSRLEKALELEPRNAALRLEYAFQLTESGDKAKALGVLEGLLRDPSLAADSSGVPLRSDIAGLLIKLGEGEMANTLLLDIVSGGRGDSKTWTQVGLGYMDKGNFPQAVASLEKALSLDPDNALALSGLGTIHLTLFRSRKEKEDLEAAIAFYTKAKEASPGLVAAWNGLGAAWSFAGDPEQAVAHWRRALEIDPGFTNTYFNLGITLLKSGRKDEARRVLSVCLERYSSKLSEAELRQLRALLEEASR